MGFDMAKLLNLEEMDQSLLDSLIEEHFFKDEDENLLHE